MSLSVFSHFVWLRMKVEVEYRAAFILGVIAQILGYSGSYLVIWLLLVRFESIAGWNWPEIAFLYSLDLFTYALGAAFTLQMTALENMVRRGTFDEILVKPVNPFFCLIAQHFNLGYLAHIILAGSILIWMMTQVPVQWTLLNLLYLGLIVISGTMVQAAMLTLIGACSFTLVRTGFLFSLHFRLKSFISYPISVYSVMVQILLTVVVPLAFINFYPASTLLSKEGYFFPGWVGWLAPGVGPLFLWVAYTVWMRSLRSYQGAGG